jgi:uncharacterized OB-fold protein
METKPSTGCEALPSTGREALEFTATSFYEFLAGHKLMGTRCSCDETVFLPPRAYCPHCVKQSPLQGAKRYMEWLEFSGKGKLLTFTVVYIGPAAMIAAGFDRKNPYCVGIVELAEGPRISAMLTGINPMQPESIALGSPVSLDVQELGPEGAKKAVLAFHLD